MRIAVTSTHTPRYAPLAQVTTPNHLAYCERHGYDYLSCRTGGEEWPDMIVHDLCRLSRTLRNYDAVLKVETDIIFTNMDRSVEDFIEKGDSVIVGREPKGRAVLNVGSMIFVRQFNFGALHLLSTVISESKLWADRHDDCYWQNHLGRMVQCADPTARCVRLVPPRLINATDQTESPEWTWQPGDFVCHCGGGSVESRIERCKEAMRKAGV